MPPATKRIAATIVCILGLSAVGFFVFKQQAQPSAIETPAAVEELTLEQFSDKVIGSAQVLLLDVRPGTDYAAEHIPDSVSMPSYEVDARINELKLFNSWEIILIAGQSGADGAATPDVQLSQASRELVQNGFGKLFALSGGYATYKDADLSVVSQASLIQEDLAKVLGSIKVPELSVDELKSKLADKKTADDIALIDGRTSFEFVTGFIPGATNIPLHAFGASMDRGFIPTDKNATIVVYDRVGNRAKIGAQALIDAGYKHVFSLTGGIEAWTAAKGDVALPKEDGSDLPDLIPVLYPEQ